MRCAPVEVSLRVEAGLLAKKQGGVVLAITVGERLRGHGQGRCREVAD